jgi:hypothetical protein
VIAVYKTRILTGYLSIVLGAVTYIVDKVGLPIPVGFNLTEVDGTREVNYVVCETHRSE